MVAVEEATAFAAGYRPRAYCRRKRYSEFKKVWCSANAALIDRPDPPVAEIDFQLPAERVTRNGTRLPVGSSLAAFRLTHSSCVGRRPV